MKISKLVSFNSPQSPIIRALNIEKLGSYFIADVKISVIESGRQTYSFKGRDELQQAALAARSNTSRLRVEFLKPEIQVASGGQSATVQTVMLVDTETGADNLPLKITFQKIDRDWLITAVQTSADAKFRELQ